MNPKSPEQSGKDKKEDEGMLEKIANIIDPSGADVSDDELMDPGTNIKDFPSQENKTNRNPSQQR